MWFHLPKQHRWPSVMRRLRVRGWWQKNHGSGSKCVKSTWIEAWSLADKILLEALHFLQIISSYEICYSSIDCEKDQNIANCEFAFPYCSQQYSFTNNALTWGCTCRHILQLRSAWCKLGLASLKKWDPILSRLATLSTGCQGCKITSKESNSAKC